MSPPDAAAWPDLSGRLVVDAAWQVSTFADLELPHVDGPYPRGYTLIRWLSGQVFKASMTELLNPGKRLTKSFVTDEDIIIDVAPRVTLTGTETGLSIKLPKGMPAVSLNSLRYKDLLQDIVLAARDPDKLETKYQDLLTVRRFKELKQGLAQLRDTLRAELGRFTLDISQIQGDFIQAYYSNVLTTRVENAGHRFGEDLTDLEKQALIAFLATL
jgi:hypothetical protein